VPPVSYLRRIESASSFSAGGGGKRLQVPVDDWTYDLICAIAHHCDIAKTDAVRKLLSLGFHSDWIDNICLEEEEQYRRLSEY
jgi:hypothetical protein